ncbi:MAG: 50S ribosomal protein L35 [Candidatus Uhrbacteria bacterium]|nr:50S ribosomal protein L35 [Candidatus Uhrbacteria bacterium]
MALKTHKALAKRVRITRTGKIIKRKAGQDHFNGRESGNTTRNKRTDINVSKTLRRAIKTLLPYSN